MADKKPVAKPPKAIVDVAQPGTTAPATSGKSVIVTNRPMLKDPMVVDDQDPSLDQAKAGDGSVKVTVTSKSKASPQTAPLESVADNTTAPELPTVSGKKDSALSTAKTEPKPVTPQPETKAAPATEEKTDDQAAAETTDEPVTPVPSAAEQEAAAAAAAEHSATVQKLIDSKQYFLTINSIEKRKNKRFVILGIVLSIFLAAAWVDIALDANLIQINGVKPLTHFFSN